MANSDDPIPYDLTPEGIKLTDGSKFEAHGHVNIRFKREDGSVGTKNIHFDPNNNQPGGAWIGKDFIPWSAFGIDEGDCVVWIQLSKYNEHFGEGGQDAYCVVGEEEPVLPVDPAPVDPEPTDPDEPEVPVDPVDPDEPEGPEETDTDEPDEPTDGDTDEPEEPSDGDDGMIIQPIDDGGDVPPELTLPDLPEPVAVEGTVVKYEPADTLAMTGGVGDFTGIAVAGALVAAGVTMMVRKAVLSR